MYQPSSNFKGECRIPSLSLIQSISGNRGRGSYFIAKFARFQGLQFFPKTSRIDVYILVC